MAFVVPNSALPEIPRHGQSQSQTQLQPRPLPQYALRQPPPPQTQLHRGTSISPASAALASASLAAATPHVPYSPRVRVADRYKVIGFISSGTYGRVYKAFARRGASTTSPAVTTAAVPASSAAASPAVSPSSSSSAAVREFAIKKFKPDKEGEPSYTGISQSAIREMALCTELSHPNVIRLVEIILEDKCIFMVFEYAEHDLLQIIHHHTTQQPRSAIPASVVRSIMFQLLNGCLYLHSNWVMHRDLKPANIMVTSAGEVKIGDLGLARRFDRPLQSLFSGDKVVVTIWYRAPELILGSHHYTPAIDLWAVGCIFAELLSLRPIFRGEEAKMDSKKTVPFQRNQMQQIANIMGVPTKEKWPLLAAMPEYHHLASLQGPPVSSQQQRPPQQHHHRHHHHHHHHDHHHNPLHLHHHRSHQLSPPPPPPAPPPPSIPPDSSLPDSCQLEKWYFSTITQGASTSAATFPPPVTSTSTTPTTPLSPLGTDGYALMARLLEYDPERRITAEQALEHPFFSSDDKQLRVSENCFEGLRAEYPHRRVFQEDNDIRTGSLPGTKRTGVPAEDSLRPAKRLKDV